MQFFKKYLFWALLLGLVSCSSDNGTEDPNDSIYRGDIVSVSIKREYTAAQLSAAISATYPSITLLYDVAAYKVVYKTLDSNFTVINASGIMAIATNKNPNASSPLLSMQHGTIFEDIHAPSSQLEPSLEPQLTFAEVIASLGYIVVMPDYIGYVDSSDQMHSYVHADLLAGATVDLLRAVRDYLAQNNINTNDQLFLTGYSEGGYATLAAHKYIEESLGGEFEVTASAPGAGSYDMVATANYHLARVAQPYPENIAFVFKAYDTIYNWNRIADFFQANYVDVVNTSYDGLHEQTTIRGNLTNVTANLFNATFLNEFLGNGELEVKAALAENDIYNWAPNAPVRLFHGQVDDLVPYANSTTARDAMVTNGSTNVELVDCVPPDNVAADHLNCAGPYLLDVVNYFSNIATDLVP